MTPEEKRRRAFERFDELLVKGVSLDEAIVQAAVENELKQDVFRTIASKELGDLNEHNRKLHIRALNSAIEAEIAHAHAKRDPNSIFGAPFDIDEVAGRVEERIGRPLSEAEVERIKSAWKDSILARARRVST